MQDEQTKKGENDKKEKMKLCDFALAWVKIILLALRLEFYEGRCGSAVQGWSQSFSSRVFDSLASEVVFAMLDKTALCSWSPDTPHPASSRSLCVYPDLHYKENLYIFRIGIQALAVVIWGKGKYLEDGAFESTMYSTAGDTA